ncbi:MAG TPA: hypothetical protein ENI19_03470 [Candidatus Nealsonbacteria bacterium]|uniref:Orotate phosphoribosyltransferase n=1 Tax=marine sediment metagenome TaxID=412755 RepID=A0A0F9VCL0_9ZZZZ|nr:hypothetical protein [Candidatus Nealsonbacteria bacterium]HEB46737.1 hypothetical protein [Candidatus Nealsonbacteria bacterium]
MGIENNALNILEAGAVEIRNVPLKVTNEEVETLPRGKQPFLYASGNWGPGYVMIKDLVGRKKTIKLLIKQLAIKVAREIPRLDFVAGNVTGGIIPGWQLSEELELLLGKTIPFVYIREARKKGGQKELITGIAGNPEIPPGANGLVVEELVNFAQTTCNSADILREAGHVVNYAATILFYDNPEAIRILQERGIEMIYLLTLPELLTVAEKHLIFSQQAIESYRTFLTNPLEWQMTKGLRPIERGGTL